MIMSSSSPLLLRMCMPLLLLRRGQKTASERGERKREEREGGREGERGEREKERKQLGEMLLRLQKTWHVERKRGMYCCRAVACCCRRYGIASVLQWQLTHRRLHFSLSLSPIIAFSLRPLFSATCFSDMGQKSLSLTSFLSPLSLLSLLSSLIFLSIMAFLFCLLKSSPFWTRATDSAAARINCQTGVCVLMSVSDDSLDFF